MARRFGDILGDMKDALSGRKPGHNWGGSAGDVVDTAVQGVKGFGGDTLAKTAARFNDVMPYIERAGYDVTEIEVGLGLSPKLVAHLALRDMLDPAEQAALLDETADQRLTNTVLSSLFRASAARSKLRFKRFHFAHLELELSILPTAVLKFRPNVEAGDLAGCELTEVDEITAGLVEEDISVEVGEEISRAMDKDPHSA